MEKNMTTLDSSIVVPTDDTEMLSRLCISLRKAIANQTAISDRTILDFSRLAGKLLYGGVTSMLPDSFSTLAQDLEDYWLYSAKRDRDKDRCFTYISIYQITKMVKTVEIEERRNVQLSEEAQIEKNKGTFEILSQIYKSPGITHKALGQELDITPSLLSQKAAKLEDKGYLFSRRSGRNKTYTLSNYGISLYKRMAAFHNESGERFSKKQLDVSTKLFHYLSNWCPDDGVEKQNVFAVLNYVANCSPQEVDELQERLEMSNCIYNNKNSSYYSDGLKDADDDWGNIGHENGNSLFPTSRKPLGKRSQANMRMLSNNK